MHIERLHLEVTRNCTLECEHCLRGNKEISYMDPEILDYIFHDVKIVDKLLLTGGEPLLAIKVIEKLIEILKREDVEVGSLEIITNGTIFSERILLDLMELQEMTRLDFRLSIDIFHKLELQRLGLLERRTRNLEKMTDYIKVNEYGSDRDGRINHGLINKGRALNLTNERLNEINKLVEDNYIIVDEDVESMDYIKYIPFTDGVLGVVTVDVKGRLVPYSLSYEEEDEFALKNEIDIRVVGFRDAIIQYTNVDKGHRKILWF